jgi:hypothetical protein
MNTSPSVVDSDSAAFDAITLVRQGLLPGYLFDTWRATRGYYPFRRIVDVSAIFIALLFALVIGAVLAANWLVHTLRTWAAFAALPWYLPTVLTMLVLFTGTVVLIIVCVIILMIMHDINDGIKAQFNVAVKSIIVYHDGYREWEDFKHFPQSADQLRQWFSHTLTRLCCEACKDMLEDRDCNPSPGKKVTPLAIARARCRHYHHVDALIYAAELLDMVPKDNLHIAIYRRDRFEEERLEAAEDEKNAHRRVG